MSKLLSILILIGLFISCHPSEEPDYDTQLINLTMDPLHLPPISKLSDLVTGVRIIPLETNSSVIMGSTSDIYVGDRDMLVSSNGNNPQLLHFNSDGRYLNRIGSKGKGPGEYYDVNRISVFDDPPRVYIYPTQMKKALEYSFKGELINEIPFGKDFSSSTIIDQDRIAHLSFIDYEVNITNTLTSDTAKYIKIDEAERPFLRSLTGNPLTGFYYNSSGKDTIWSVHQDTIRPIISCDFGSGHFSTNEFRQSVLMGEDYPPHTLYIGALKVFNGAGYYHFMLTREDSEGIYMWAHVFVDENTHASWHLDEGTHSDDILFCTSTDFRTVSKSGEWVSVVGAGELIDALPKIKSNQDFEYTPELIKKIEALTIEDNPVLVLYTLR